MILLQYPTRWRPEIFKRNFELWVVRCDRPEEVVCNIVINSDDESMNNKELDSFLMSTARFGTVIISEAMLKSKIQAFNHNCLEQKDISFVVAAQDDMEPVQGWDSNIKALTKHIGEERWVLWDNDGRQNRINCLSIMSRVALEWFGYIYNPIYLSEYADNEYTFVSECEGMTVRTPEGNPLVMKHLWTKATGQDKLFLLNRRFVNGDAQTWVKRKKYLEDFYGRECVY